MAERDEEKAIETTTDNATRGSTGVLLKIQSPLGPFARLFPDRLLPLDPMVVVLRDAVMAKQPAQELVIAWSAADSGLEAPGRLEAEIIVDSVTGNPDRLALRGKVSARPGRYLGFVRLAAADDAAKPLVVPVTVEVAASATWGVGFMLLGLMALGLVSVLEGEGQLHDKQREVLEAAQSFHERLERSPLPQRFELDVADVDRAAKLSEPRPLGFIDHRQTDAQEQLVRATQLQASLAREVAGTAGDPEVNALLGEWQKFLDLSRDLALEAPAWDASAPRPAAAAGLSALVDAYQARFAQRFIAVRLFYYKSQLTDVVLALRLAASAGRSDEARARAQVARRWLQRASDDLAQGQALAKNQKLLGINLVSNGTQIKLRLDTSDLAPDRKAALQALLDGAAASFAVEPPPVGHADDLAFAQASRQVSRAAVELTAARSDLLLARLRPALASLDAETGLGDIEQALAHEQASPPKSTAEKVSSLRRILEVWHVKIGRVPDEAVRRSLGERVDAVLAILDAALQGGDLTQAGPAYKALLDAWTAWGMRRVRETTAAVMAPYCEEDRQFDLVRVAQMTETLRQKEPRPELAQWERELDRLRSDTLAIDSKALTEGPECRQRLEAVEKRTMDLGNEIFRLETLDAAIPVSEQRAALEQLGLDARALEGPRHLKIEVVAPSEQRVAGRRLRFRLGNVDPAWGAGVTIAVNFGDGSAPFRTSAEAVARDQPIEHVYEKADTSVTVHVVAAAQDDPLAKTVQPLADGTLPLAIGPSEVSAARLLADSFLNIRFLVALLIASVIYYWRFQSSKRVLGARSFDYVEAFALGFVVNAAVVDLPASLAKLAR